MLLSVPVLHFEHHNVGSVYLMLGARGLILCMLFCFLFLGHILFSVQASRVF